MLPCRFLWIFCQLHKLYHQQLTRAIKATQLQWKINFGGVFDGYLLLFTNCLESYNEKAAPEDFRLPGQQLNVHFTFD
jgi:hypothetical protein